MVGKQIVPEGTVTEVDTSVELCGLRLDNPVVPASGTFGYGYEFKDFYDINILGSFSFKGTTREPRFGNPTPRIAECTAGMINSVGLQNPGIDAVIRHELPRLRQFFRKPVMLLLVENCILPVVSIAEDNLQNPFHGPVKNRLRKCAFLNGTDNFCVRGPAAAWHFQIQTGGQSLHPVVDCAPIAHHISVEAPFIPQNFG